MKKILLLCLAMVIALGGLGVGYAAWTDQIVIRGTVNTGSLDLVVERVNWDRVFKDLDNDGVFYDHVIYDYTIPGYIDPPEEPANGVLIASTSSQLIADDTVEISYNNLFPYNGPYTGWVTSVLFHCLGTVPVKIDATAVVSGLECSYVVYRWFVYDETGALIDSAIDQPDLNGLDGKQLHNCMTVSIGISVVVPQLECSMGESGSIAITIDGIQWNEYVPD